MEVARPNACQNARQSLEVFVSGVSSTLPRSPVEPAIVALSKNNWGQALPVLRLTSGMLAPLKLERAVISGNTTSMVISAEGTLYSTKFDRRFDSLFVLVFAADGTQQQPPPPLNLKSLGLLRQSTCMVAFADGFEKGPGTLLLSDSAKLVAVDSASRAVRWSAALKKQCFGIAVLPAQGAVVATIYESDELLAFRLSDGALMFRVKALSPIGVAADPDTATVYVSCSFGTVSAYCWTGTSLVFDGVVFEEICRFDWRLLAVVPRAPSQCASYLVVVRLGSHVLRVFSLPDRRLVHTHMLEGMQIVGLAADPSGTALAIGDLISNSIHVLPWPLSGM